MRSLKNDLTKFDESEISTPNPQTPGLLFIIDFIYEVGKNAPELPFAIIIEFNDYKGPKFFNGHGQDKWVPILTEEYKWGDHSKL